MFVEFVRTLGSCYDSLFYFRIIFVVDARAQVRKDINYFKVIASYSQVLNLPILRAFFMLLI